MVYIDEKEEFADQVAALTNRTKSPKIDRKDKNRHV